MLIKNKILFKFIFILFCLLIFPWPFSKLPGLSLLTEHHSNIFEHLISWFGYDLLGIESKISSAATGSGDKIYDYLLLLLFAIISLIGTLLWHFVGNGPRTYDRLNYILEIILRYFLAYQMIHYGLFKIIPVQFFEPYYYKLLQPYGQGSLMGIYWTMMGVSKGYALFAGLLEFFSGILLIHRKTKLLGCLIAIGVLINVVAINFFYDIPVKLFSLQLLIIAVLLTTPYIGRLTKAILADQGLEKRKTEPLFFNTGKWVAFSRILKWGFIILLFFTSLSAAVKSYTARTENKVKIPLYGLYEIKNSVINKDTLTPRNKFAGSWRYLIVESDKYAQVVQTDMKRNGYEFEVDSINGKFMMKSFRDSTDVFTFNYIKTDSTLTFFGVVENDTLHYESRILTKKNFLLMNRGFHWINEYPYNR
ncbi:hypothetical protein ACEZ3G_12450 [Maribacter algicola]|uniref:Uncharacterized protein n=1 Tax=Meishania litoralis TaxID=3434685 RepID=A0ACC7LL29_9FLAO